MKNTFKTLFALALLCSVAFIFSSCIFDPNFGLEEITFEEITKAELYDNYDYTIETNTYDSDGTQTKHEVTSGTATAAEVKATALTGKATIEAGKLLKTYSGGVRANKKFKKIVIYIYTNNSDGKQIGSVITTYTKK
jgi:hypothetical protein